MLWLSQRSYSQNNDLINKLSSVNYIEIKFLKGKQPDVYKTHKSIDILYLKDLITKAKNKPELVSDTTGKIIYYKNKKQLFEAYFSSKQSGSKYNSSGAVMFQNSQRNVKSLLNYGSGMLINEKYYQLNK
jgi:hypothetical protein